MVLHQKWAWPRHFYVLLFGGWWCYGVVAGVLPQPHFDNVKGRLTSQNIILSLQQGPNFEIETLPHCIRVSFHSAHLCANLRKRHTTDGVTDFRSMSTELRRLSEEQGQSSQQFRRQRDTITDEQYWEKEAEHFKRESARREFETREKWRSDLGAILSSTQSESDDGGETATQEFVHCRETMPSVMPKEC